MAKVTYELDGREIEVEFADEKAEAYFAFCESERKAEERERWRRRKKLCSLEKLSEVGREVADKDVNFDVYLEMDELKQAMSALTNGQRLVLKLHYIDGYSLTEIAEQLLVDRTAVGKQVKRALIKLKNIYEDRPVLGVAAPYR